MTMRHLVHRRSGLAAGLLALATIGAAPAPHADFAQKEGLNLNSFERSGPVSAHVVLRSGSDPRLIVAFPAGNSGVGLWFAGIDHPAEWTMPAPAQPITIRDAKGRALHGVRFTAIIATPRLEAKQAVLSSIRVLRDYQALGTAPAEVLTPPVADRTGLVWSRDRLDGAPGYRLEVHGAMRGGAFVADKSGRITLSITAVTGETPLTPLSGKDLLTPAANADPKARAALEYLSYREKFLAGSWRFDTYFGRDTLMSVRLLMPVLQPLAVESGLRSVLERLSPEGKVAHEEDIGEFAILDHRREDGTSSAAPTFNYKMIDSHFMLAPVARAWLLDDARGRARAGNFLAGKGAGAELMRNLRFVMAEAEPFARDPVVGKLIGLEPGMQVGEWRDSNDGLGGGHYPYDVNAVFVPAALEAADALYRAGLLTPYLSAEDRAAFDRLPAMIAIWREKAPGLFAMEVPADRAAEDVRAYARQAGVPAAPALAALKGGPVRFHAIALDRDGKPVPIENSDMGFDLLFGHPTKADLDQTAQLISRPFPAGLRTGVGMLVANPVFASAALQARFGPNAYHGTVIWSWQQALAAAGLARQLGRKDLPADLRTKLTNAQACLWDGIDATRSVQRSELWSWAYKDGAYRIVAFGAGAKDVDESNAAQLWSTVFLALKRPAGAGHCPSASATARTYP